MIDVENLTKVYGDIRAVDDITFHMGEGEIVGVLGPNGAGKTTIMRILTCFIPATSGTARVVGHDVFSESLQVRQNIGYLPENNPLYPEMRVTEYLKFRAKLKYVPRKERRTRMGEALERCGATEFANQVIGTLSKGQRQRVGLADCLLHNPKILILDEPTVGLDPNQIRHVRQLIKQLSSSHTVLISTHILPEVESVCERFMIIHNGKLACQMRVDELQSSPYLDIEVAAPEGELREALRTMKGVRHVRRAGDATFDGAHRLTLELDDGGDPRAEIFEMLSHKQWKLLELRQRALTLEEIFVQTTTQDETETAKKEGTS
ncbi:MAG: ATP-binding cassette domain-containing protein [Planctomycetes bacterium]|jgi:ABC-2 type transport system ATP-binding protein|nr:ATP-binding cassette domain-containing protein [Planctomycetota bacterium]